MKQKILVTGATGAQGSAVVRQLQRDGFSVRALLTTKEDDRWFKENNIETVKGSFDDEASLVEALKGITNVSLVYPLIYNYELLRMYTRNLISAFQKNNLQSIVFNTSLPLPPARTGSLPADIKLEFYEAFVAAKLPLITISPSFYLDNISAPWSLPVIKEQGIVSYPLPGDAQFAWLSHYNLAQYTVSALTKPALIGKTFIIGGELISGNEIANRLTSFVGKPVHYHFLKAAEYKQFLMQLYPEHIADEIANIYGHIANNTEPLKAFYNPDVINSVFGIRLQTFDEWAKTIQWK